MQAKHNYLSIVFKLFFILDSQHFHSCVSKSFSALLLWYIDSHLIVTRNIVQSRRLVLPTCPLCVLPTLLQSPWFTRTDIKLILSYISWGGVSLSKTSPFFCHVMLFRNFYFNLISYSSYIFFLAISLLLLSLASELVILQFYD